ncbi:MAG: glycosyltransferase [Thermodesulfobacteriota bacterium]|nr:MAG: glycosyltransferase [Thermodesulfobacteriota bacterium]
MNNIIHSIVSGFNYGVIVYFVAANAVYLFLLFVATVVVLRHLKKLKYGRYQETMQPALALPVSVLIAAYNEEENIVDTVKALLRLDYPSYEVIVINDGSTDSTLKKLIEDFALERMDLVYRPIVHTAPVAGFYVSPEIPNLTVVDKAHAGKADSLNVGINVSRSPYFCSVDGDSILEEKAIIRLMRTIVENPEQVIANGGIVRILNGSIMREGRLEELKLPSDSLSRLQVVEYIRSFLFGRAGWSAINSLVIISGTFSMFQKRAVLAVGGYSTDTVTEDLDLIITLHEHMMDSKERYRILFVPDPICWTEAPQTLSMLARQRRRWHMGLAESLYRHRRMLFNPKYGRIGLIALPYQLIIELLGPVIEIGGYVVVTTSFFLGAVDEKFFMLFLTMAILLGVLLSTGSILLEEMSYRRYPRGRDFLLLLLYGVLENFGYRQINSFWRTQAVFKKIFRKKKWEHVKKSGFKWDGEKQEKGQTHP